MKTSKLQLLFLIIAFCTCTLQAVANDTITLSMKNLIYTKLHYITATAGEQFKVNYSNTSTTYYYTGTGVFMPIEYLCNTNQDNITCTIVALSENCLFTEFKPDGRTTSLDLSLCPSIVKLLASNVATKALTNLNLQNCVNLENLSCSYHPLYNLDISHCKALKELDCAENNLSNLVLHDSVMLNGFGINNNHLSLSNIYAITLQTLYPEWSYCCCQTLPQINVEVGDPVDFSSEHVFEGILTNYWVSRDGQPISESDFTFNDGVFTFHYFGNYKVTRQNSAVVCRDGSYVSTPIMVSSNTSDATLSSLTVTNCSTTQFELAPEYQWDIFNYDVDVNYTTSLVCISATPAYSQATVSGNGTFPLEVGENIFTITVTSADGTAELEYTVTVTRAAPNTDATLLNLAVSTGELTPEFSSIIHDYTVDVAYSTNSINITATTNDPKATISGTGWKQLAVGENIFTVTVTAEDGVTTLEYTITVTRAAPNTDATLLDLAVSTGELTPEFSSIIHDYTVDVTYSTSSINITATASDPYASISGTGWKQLAVGENVFTITVIAEDGITTLEYTVTVTRADDVGISESVLAGISIEPNPTTGELRIESGELTIENVEVLDISGRKQKVESKKENVLDISHLPTGIYFVKISTETGEVVRKVVKE